MNACKSDGSHDDMASVEGIIKDWNDQALEGVRVTPGKVPYATTLVNGQFQLELPLNEGYTITPSKEESPLNGVSTFDLVLISKHILGIENFKNPYQWIAADINRSKSITAFDLVQLRKLILNIDRKFNNNSSWRFVDSDYQFTTKNPLTENFPESAIIKELQQDTLLRFTGVKIGDVNGNALPGSQATGEGRNNLSFFEISVNDQILEAGERYQVSFRADQFEKILGYQFTLAFNGLKMNKLTAKKAQVENFGLHKMNEGLITTSWHQTINQDEQVNNSEKTDYSRTDLFQIEFIALRNGRLSEQLSMIEAPTEIEAIDHNEEIMGIRLIFNSPTDSDQFELYQNFPNPFKEETEIGFNLPEKSDVQLIIRDETGRILQTIQTEGVPGYQSIRIKKSDLKIGFNYYELVV